MKARLYVRDEDIAKVLRISPRTLKAMVHGFVRGGAGGHKTHSMLEQNILKAEPEDFGGYRLWRVSKFAAAFGFTVDEVLAAIDA